ncbi:MAG TPA: hypothetical protein VEJ87_06155 [Acidimicrobiales bacterium]|nr:hypothetical protein [Acidimicrobiales bacterium]
MINKRLITVALSLLVISGASTSGVILATGGVAGAHGNTYKADHFTNYSSFVENAVKTEFSCSASTGDYTLTMSNINVDSSSGQSFVAADLNTSNSLVLQFNGGEQDLYAPMNENSTNGLFQVDATGTMYAPFCELSGSVEVFDALTEGGDLLFYDTLK